MAQSLRRGGRAGRRVMASHGRGRGVLAFSADADAGLADRCVCGTVCSPRVLWLRIPRLTWLRLIDGTQSRAARTYTYRTTLLQEPVGVHTAPVPAGARGRDRGGTGTGGRDELSLSPVQGGPSPTPTLRLRHLAELPVTRRFRAHTFRTKILGRPLGLARAPGRGGSGARVQLTSSSTPRRFRRVASNGDAIRCAMIGTVPRPAPPSGPGSGPRKRRVGAWAVALSDTQSLNDTHLTHRSQPLHI